MKAAKLIKPGMIVISEEEMPQIRGSRDVLVKVRAAGICGTDIHIFENGRNDVELPRILGHELAGEVMETGCDVRSIHVGDHVVLDPVFSCGTCKTCKGGRPNVCRDVKCYGVQMDGGFREYIVVEEEHLYTFSHKISWKQAALAEPFSIGANIVSRAGVSPNDNVVVIGSGTIGLCAAQAARWAGAKVLISDVEESKLDIARKAGVDAAVNSMKTSLEKAVERFSPGGADVVIDAVGTAALVERGIRLTAPGARVAVIGFDCKPALIPPEAATKKELMIIGSRMNNHRFPMVINWLEAGNIREDIMITAEYSFRDIQKAFEETAGNGKNIKTVILM